jgi:DNA polymerase-1
VALPPALARYQLPTVPSDVVGAVRQSLRLLAVAPLAVTVPLWGAVYRAPLATFCPADVTVWVEGQSGSLKSTLAALFLSHYGHFERTQLPESWEHG